MKSLLRNIAARLGAFIAVMAVCYGIVAAGAWHSSVVSPALSVSLPSFSADIKAAAAGLHAKMTDPCPLPPGNIGKVEECDSVSPVCGRHDVDSCGAPSLYCGCHAHDDQYPGMVATGAPDSLPASVAISYASHVRLPVLNEAVVSEFLLVFESERPPSSPLV